MVTVTTKQKRRIMCPRGQIHSKLCFILLPPSLSLCLYFFSGVLLSFCLPATKQKFQANIWYTYMYQIMLCLPFQKLCYLDMDKRSKGKKILFVCERNSAQSPFVSRNIGWARKLNWIFISLQRNYCKRMKFKVLYIAIIQDGGDVQPLPGKAKEHDGKQFQFNMLSVNIKMVNNCKCCLWR